MAEQPEYLFIRMHNNADTLCCERHYKNTAGGIFSIESVFAFVTLVSARIDTSPSVLSESLVLMSGLFILGLCLLLIVYDLLKEGGILEEELNFVWENGANFLNKVLQFFVILRYISAAHL